MGVKERKERDRSQMRELILHAAHSLFLERNFEGISIRNIADAIEYSPAVIYQYFKDKDQLFYALQGEAFRVFNSYVADVMLINDPFERLLKLTEEYVQFMFTYPKYYTIMFILESPMKSDENSENWQEGTKAHIFLERIVSDCQEQGHFKNLDTKVLSFSIWSYMHGMCSLALGNRMRIYPSQDREKIRAASFKQFVIFLQSL